MTNDGRYNFNWDSYYSVSNNQKYEIISRLRRLDGTEDLKVIEDLQEEWDKIYVDGEDPSLLEKFNAEIEKFKEKKERVTKSIDGKKALIAKVNEMKDSDDFFATAEAFKEYQAQWRDLGYSGKEQNDALWEEFSALNDYFFERRNQFYEDQNQQREEAKKVKEQLIEEAEALQDSTDWYKVSRRQRELMDAWREAGFASREVENQLWERFNSARQNFYKAQEAFFQELRERENQAKEVKEKLIKETEDLKDSVDFDAVRKRFDEMMEEWKEAGHSGRKFEEELWAQFRAGRDHFYGRLTETTQVNRETKRDEVLAKVDDVNHRLDALEDMRHVIEAKISQLESRPDGEATNAELEETRSYLENNQIETNGLLKELDRLNNELEKN